MPRPLRNRFVHLELEPDFEDWSRWTVKAGIRPEILAFLRFKPALLHDADATSDQNAWPTPRSWRMASSVLSGVVQQQGSHFQKRDDHWAIIDLYGKGGHIRTVPVPAWVKVCLDEWLTAAKIEDGVVFRCVSRTGKVWGSGITEKVVWWVVRECAEKAGIERLAPHDLRRTCARLCHSAGGELEQIQFLLGHRSVETTERYLGSRQRLVHAVNDRLGIEPECGSS
jgi:integrase